MLEYKAARYGRTFVKIDRWFPSSKLCSECGTLQESMPLNVRDWVCACGATHDRDVNAVINVLAEGRRVVAAGRKPAAEMRQEAGERRAAVDVLRQAQDIYRSLGNQAGMGRTLELLRRTEG